MAKLQVVIPFLTELWCIQDCVESMGKSDIPVLIVDNSPTSETRIIKDWPANVEVVCYPQNIGIAASWNLGLKKGADQTLIVSQWVRFAPMDLPRRKDISWGLDWVAKNIDEQASEYGLTFGDQGFHCICIGKRTVETIGYCDENFIYNGEDDDYIHRMNLAEIKGLLPDWGDYRQSQICSIAHSAHKRGAEMLKVSRVGIRMADYYSLKWCSVMYDYPGDYKTPFNNPNAGLDYWPEVQL